MTTKRIKFTLYNYSTARIDRHYVDGFVDFSIRKVSSYEYAAVADFDVIRNNAGLKQSSYKGVVRFTDAEIYDKYGRFDTPKKQASFVYRLFWGQIRASLEKQFDAENEA